MDGKKNTISRATMNGCYTSLPTKWRSGKLQQQLQEAMKKRKDSNGTSSSPKPTSKPNN
jgi:hypothetical protein